MPLLHLVALLLGVILQVLLPGSHGIGERGLAGVGIAGVVAELAASVDLEGQELVAGGHIGCGLGQLLVELLTAEVLVGLAVGVGQGRSY